MRKYLLIVGLVLLNYMLAAQTIVSTTPASKNVIIEEFTGACCPNCPDAHKRVNEIMAANPGRAWGINIHSGYFAEGESCESRFRTADGDTLHTYFYPGISAYGGYPAGTVNRGSIEGRGNWSATTNTKLAESSYLNVAAEGTVDWSTRTLTLLVEVYYTGNATVSENYLTIALLQNNIEGYQSGGIYNPTQVIPNGDYNHMHMLRDIISPVWGDTINTVIQGSFYTKTYTYSIPESINTVDVLLEDIEILAYVTETKVTVISGTKAEITHTNRPELKFQASFDDIAGSYQPLGCDPLNTVYVRIKNIGMDTITSVSYNLKKDNNTVLQNQTWSNRSILPGNIDTISIRNLDINANIVNVFSLEITKVNDKDTVISLPNLNVTKNIVESAGGNMTFRIVTDAYAYYTSFVIYDPTGSAVIYGNKTTATAWSNLTAVGTTERLYDFRPTTTGCYTLFVEDGTGAGINKGYGAGYFELIAEDGTTKLLYNDGKFGSFIRYNIVVTKPGAVPNHTISDLITVFPNPANDRITILSEDIPVQRVELYNMQGQLIKIDQLNDNTMDVSNLAAGMYSVRIITEKGVAVKNIIKR